MVLFSIEFYRVDSMTNANKANVHSCYLFLSFWTKITKPTKYPEKKKKKKTFKYTVDMGPSQCYTPYYSAFFLASIVLCMSRLLKFFLSLWHLFWQSFWRFIWHLFRHGANTAPESPVLPTRLWCTLLGWRRQAAGRGQAAYGWLG